MSTVKLVINIGRITVTKYGTTPVNKKKRKNQIQNVAGITNRKESEMVQILKKKKN